MAIESGVPAKAADVLDGIVPIGAVLPYTGSSAPAGYLLCDGSAVSRTTYATLFGIIGTDYGAGDGSTTFNLPDSRGRSAIGAGTGTKTATIASISGNVFTVTGLTNAANNEYQTGQAIVFTAGVAGNLTTATTYYVVRTGNLTFSVATTLANAQNGTVVTLAGTETGHFTLTLTTRSLGDTGGEEDHAMNSSELLSHTHTITQATSSGSGVQVEMQSPFLPQTGTNTGSTGGNATMNNMQPFFAVNWIIRWRLYP